MSTPLCHKDDIRDPGSRGFEVGERTIFAVKRDGQIHVYVNSCPHIGIPLEFIPDDFLDSEQRFILCANHGALFEIDNGMCVAGPCQGQALIPVPFVLNDGVIEIDEIPEGY